MIMNVPDIFMALLKNDCEECQDICTSEKEKACWARVNLLCFQIEELKRRENK